MNKNVCRAVLLAGACLVTSASAVSSNKTHFAARNELQRAGETWAMSAPHKTGKCTKRGISFGANLFYRESNNKVGLGKHFGVSNKADGSDATNLVQVMLADDATTNALVGRDIDHTHVQANDAAPMKGTLNLLPFQHRVGINLGASVDLGKWSSVYGWDLSVSVPVVQVINNMGSTVSGSVASVADADDDKTASGTVAEFFAGTYTQPTGENVQSALAHARVITGDQKKTGIADVKVSLGYDMVNARDARLHVSGGVIIPTGTRGTGVNMFEPIVGNGRHTGALVGANGGVELWKNSDRGMSLWVSGAAEYTYLFQARETRTAGVFNSSTSENRVMPWSHAKLGVEIGEKGTFPLANVLTRSMYVTPGSHFDAVAGLTFAWKSFHVNFGYNMFYKQAERVRFADAWTMDKYGRAAYDYDGTGNAVVGDFKNGALQPRSVSNSYLSGAAVATTEHADVIACTNVDQETHAFLLSFGYDGKSFCKKFHMTANVGAGYEFAVDETKALDGFSVNAGLGVSF